MGSSALAVSLLFLAACGEVTLDPSGYDTTCDVVEDCELVATSKCGVCNCASTALSIEGAEVFYADLDAIFCIDDPASATVACDCAASPLACVDGTCTVGPEQ
jgi:hypothetical protein